ncbi:MAG: branched chain amino acid ABC transporter substrate-binding protein, partial [Candidatus Chloroheliales bacterium]
DPAQIKAAMRNVQMDSPIGPIAFDQYGDLTDQAAHLHLFEVQNGDFVEVSPK